MAAAAAATTTASFLKSTHLLSSFPISSPTLLPSILHFLPSPHRRIAAVFACPKPPRPHQTKWAKSTAIALEENNTEAAAAQAREEEEEKAAAHGDGPPRARRRAKSRNKEKEQEKAANCNGVAGGLPDAVSAPLRARRRAKSRAIEAEEEAAAGKQEEEKKVADGNGSADHLLAKLRAATVQVEEEEAEAAQSGGEEEANAADVSDEDLPSPPRRGRGRAKSRAVAVQVEEEEAAQQAKQEEEKKVVNGNGIAHDLLDVGSEEGLAKLGAIAVEDEAEGDAREEEEEKVAADVCGEEWNDTSLRPRQLFVCNLPRRCDITQLLELFKSFGTVISVEVSRDAVTGISRGCGFVTMRSLAEAKSAIAALDGYDLGGRELLVKFSSDIVSGRRNLDTLYAPPKKDKVYETPYKIYVGNLSWSVQPQDLREYFSVCGTVVSTRLLSDRKGGKGRVYAFLSFSSADEVAAALELNNSNFHGRDIVVREGHHKAT